MWLDPQFWSREFKRIFSKQISALCDSVVNRVLPAFDHIDEEAEKVAEQEYERLGSLPADEYWDTSYDAETAENAATAYYMLMSGVRQSLINIATTGLYHLFEQQLLFFHRQQVLHLSEKNNKKLINLKELRIRLADGGIDIETLPSWPKIDELRLVANTVKHGEGESAKQLRAIRQDLFVHPSLRDHSFFANSSGYTYMPLSGEDLFVEISDFQEYRNAILSFWDEFSAIILAKGTG
jgi:hypothetical protein